MLALDELYKRLPPAELEQWAVEYGVGSDVCARLPGHVVFICLLNTLLNHPLATQRLLEEAWREQTGRTTDHSSFSRALSALDPRCFAALFERIYERLAPKTSRGEASAPRIQRVDSTHVTLSAKLLAFGIRHGLCNGEAGRSIKSVIELDEGRLPRLGRVGLLQSDSSDNHAMGPVMAASTRPGDLWVFDAGVHGHEHLLGIHEAGGFMRQAAS